MIYSLKSDSAIWMIDIVQTIQAIKVIVVPMPIVAIIVWATVILSCFIDCRYKTTLCFEQYAFKVLAIVYPLSKYKSAMAWFIVFYTQHCYCYSCHRKERTKKTENKMKTLTSVYVPLHSVRLNILFVGYA